VLGYVSEDGWIVLAVLTPIHAFSLCRRQILINKGVPFRHPLLNFQGRLFLESALFFIGPEGLNRKTLRKFVLSHAV
jgi:hypothetical protein